MLLHWQELVAQWLNGNTHPSSSQGWGFKAHHPVLEQGGKKWRWNVWKTLHLNTLDPSRDVFVDKPICLPSPSLLVAQWLNDNTLPLSSQGWGYKAQPPVLEQGGKKWQGNVWKTLHLNKLDPSRDVIVDKCICLPSPSLLVAQWLNNNTLPSSSQGWGFKAQPSILEQGGKKWRGYVWKTLHLNRLDPSRDTFVDKCVFSPLSSLLVAQWLKGNTLPLSSQGWGFKAQPPILEQGGKKWRGNVWKTLHLNKLDPSRDVFVDKGVCLL